MTASIARYLKDFGEPPPTPPMPQDNDAFDFDAFAAGDTAAEEPVDLDGERVEAHREGYETGLEDARSNWEEERRKLVDAHEQELAALRQHYEMELTASIQSKMADATLLLAEAVSNQTAAILAPLVEEALVAKAISDMADLIREAIVEGDVGTVTVHGPAHLREQLVGNLDENTCTSIRHVEAPDLDVSVDLGEAALVTRMSAWSARLRELLA